MVHLTWLSGLHFVFPTANGWSEDRCWLIITQAFAEGHVASVHGAAGRLVDAERRALQRRVQLFLFNKMGQWNSKTWWITLNNYIITILNYQSAIGVPWCTQFWPIARDVEVSYVGYPKSSRLWGIYALFNGELRNYCDLRVSQPHDIRYWNIKHVDACGKLLSCWFKQQRLKIVIADRIYITTTGPATIT